MIYSNGDIYEGAWQNDLKHGYGILEKKIGDKYYGYWNNGLKEGQGYFYFSSTGKIYLGEWHEDAPRCGIFTDVDDESIRKEYEKHFMAEDGPPIIPILKLKTPETILEDSINSIHFLRNIKLAKMKTFHELFPPEFHADLIKIFSQRKYQLNDEEEKENENKLPQNLIDIKEFRSICLEKLGQEINDETLEIIFYVFGLQFCEEAKIDFMLFARLFYLIYAKKVGEDVPIEKINVNNEESGFEVDMLSTPIEDKEKDNKKIIFNFDYTGGNQDSEVNYDDGNDDQYFDEDERGDDEYYD